MEWYVCDSENEVHNLIGNSILLSLRYRWHGSDLVNLDVSHNYEWICTNHALIGHFQQTNIIDAVFPTLGLQEGRRASSTLHLEWEAT